MARFRKKPVVIDAVLWTGLEADLPAVFALVDFDKLPNDGPYVNPGIGFVPSQGTLEIPTLEGVMTAQPGDWIIRGVAGEVYPCKPDIFEATYDPVPEGPLFVALLRRLANQRSIQLEVGRRLTRR
jgi:hypothetical protein